MFKKCICCFLCGFILNVSYVREVFSAVDTAEALYLAASARGAEGVKRLVQRGYRLEQTNAQGDTALCLAALRRDSAAYNALLKAGASKNANCFKTLAQRQYQTQYNSGAAASNSKNMIYLGNGLGDTVYGEKSQYIESSSGIGVGTYAVGSLLLVAAGVGVALGAGGGGGGGGALPPSTSPETEDILNEDVPSCLGGTWENNAGTYVCVCPTGKELINGACVEIRDERQTSNVVVNDTVILNTEDDAVFAELGATVTNKGNVIGTTSSLTNDLVALKVSGFSASATQGDIEPDSDLNASAASRAINNGTIELTQTGTGGSLYGIQALAGATAINSASGEITLNAASSKPVYAMYAENDGYGLTNKGNINLNMTGDASDAFGIYAPDRGAVNEGTITVTIEDPTFSPSEVDDVAGVYSARAQNSGKILLKRGEDETELPTANEDNLNISGMLVKDGGSAENLSKGLISLDVTKTPFFVHGMYADEGTTNMSNSGRIEIFGDLASEDVVNGVGGAYAMRFTGGYGSVLNKGEIETRTCIKDEQGNCVKDENGQYQYKNLSITGDAYLSLIDGFLGSVDNQGDLLLYLTNNALPTSSWTIMGIHTLGDAADGSGIVNDADIKMDITEGTVKQGSSAYGILSSNGTIQNKGDIYITSKTDNLDLYGMWGTGTNEQYSSINILGEGANTNLYGLTGSLNGQNGGAITIEHHNSGSMYGLKGSNLSTGIISLTGKPDSDGVVAMDATGMVGTLNEGNVIVSMQKGTYGLTKLVDLSSDADGYNSGNITFYAENRTQQDIGIVKGIWASVGTAPHTLTNSAVVKIDASGKTSDNSNLKADITGIDAVGHSITNTETGKVEIRMNGTGRVIGMRNDTYLFGEEKVPQLYKMYNNGTIDIRATNTADLGGFYADKLLGGTTLIPFNVIGMMTDSFAVNNGHILLQVAGGAKVAGMVTYDGGIIINNGEINFTGTANNFTALYGTGSREIEEETKTTTQYSTVYNYGTIVVNSTGYVAENPPAFVAGAEDDVSLLAPVLADQNTANQIVCTETSCNTSDYTPGTNLAPKPLMMMSMAPAPATPSAAPAVSPTMLTMSSPVVSTTTVSPTVSSSPLSMASPKTVVLNDGVNYVSEGTASFEAEGFEIKGSVIAGLTNVLGSNESVYVAQGRGNGAIVGNGDSSSLSLKSASYMFDASFQKNINNSNGFNIVMVRKPFDAVTSNRSLASFLEANYRAGNNNAFFNEIKSIGNASAFKSAMDNLTGQDTISRFTNEDLTAMREINLTMNELMFANTEKPIFEAQGAIKGFSFKNDNSSSAQYALSSRRVSPHWKVGYAVSNVDIKTDDSNDTTRHSQMFQMFAPITYERAGMKLVSTPQMGFSRAHYTRQGYNNTSYKGTIEKRILAFINEARYPINVADFVVSPTVEFNAIAYNQKGGEDVKEYSLTMPSDHKMSVEMGWGLHANKSISDVKLSAGLMVYREFADPYDIKMSMNGMEGSFNLYDNHDDYRAEASFGFDYNVGSLDVYGRVQHFMENDTHTRAKTGLKYTF